ncbi:MAG: ThiF family adenylyltransferase [Candidatus Riflebacteria bacterium]|nr:ThiF family adenylyltransferase [Candidatus Riflebacteria bacterium]
MSYDDAYQRNIGLFTPDQQERLRRAKITVAGVGGAGGIQAATLARFGVGEIALIDPGTFDLPDMNRQFGARCSSLRMNKAVATASLLEDINPFMKVTHSTDPLLNGESLRSFVEGSALVIDAIDYLGFRTKALFARTARELGILNLSAALSDFGTLFVIFDPAGMTLEEFFGAPKAPDLMDRFRIHPGRLVGSRERGQNMWKFADGSLPYIPTCSGAGALSGAVLATEAALIIAGIRKPEDLITAPRAVVYDMLGRSVKIINPSEEWALETVRQ